MRWISVVADVRALAIFRVGVGATLLVDLVDRARAYALHLDDGPTSLATLAALHQSVWTLHRGGACATAALFVVAAVCALALLVGHRTRPAAVASLVLLVSLQERSRLCGFGGDAVLAAALFWCCLLPVGARFSRDSGFDKRAGAVSGAAVLGLLLQPVVLYSGSALCKLGAASWREGLALEQTLSAWIVTTSFGAAFAAAPVGLLRALSLTTLVVEGLAPLLLLARDPRLRTGAIVALALLQAGMESMLTVGWFAVIAIVITLPHLPPALFRDRGAVDGAAVDGAVGGAVDGAVGVGRVANVVGAVAVVVSVGSALVGPWVALPEVKLARVLGLQQTWGMFRDPASLPHGYFYVVGTGADGVLVDLLTHARAPDGAPPSTSFAALLPFRERSAWTALLYAEQAGVLPSFADHLCRRGATATPPIVRVHATFADSDAGAYVDLFDVDCTKRALQ